MKKGAEYEEFVFKIFSEFYRGFTLTLNDRILGNQSGIRREIDISMRGQVDGVELLYLVQAKDHKRPADVKIIGEFSSVIKDVGASKGFLICAAGFAKTIHRYARTLGIELLSVEDIKSNKWCADVQIPVIYIKCDIDFGVECKFQKTQELVNKNKEPLNISQNDLRSFSVDDGNTFFDVMDKVRDMTRDGQVDLSKPCLVDLTTPGIILRFSDLNVPVFELRVSLAPRKRYYLKYLTPAEYRGIKDHLNGGVAAAKVMVDGHSDLDESYVQIDGANIPVEGFRVEIEECPQVLGDTNLSGFAIAAT